MPPIINGILFGLVFFLALGPAFFALIQASVQRGFKTAIFFAFGISLSDIFFVSLTLFGISSLLQDPMTKMWMAIFGTFLLLSLGFYYWNKSPKVIVIDGNDNNHLVLLKYLFKGLILNGLNPFIVVFWITMISVVNVNYDYSLNDQFYFFTGVLMTIFTTDILKAYTADRLRFLVTTKVIRILNRLVGVVLFIFGIRIIYFLIKNYWIN